MNFLKKKYVRETIPFRVASKRIKYLVINLTQKMKALWTLKATTSMKETEDTNK